MNLRSLLIAIAGIMAIAFVSCSQKKSEKMNTENDTKTLVAYFSATGTTKKVAEDIAKVTGADLFEIKPATPYTDADLDWKDSTSRSSVEMRDKTSRPEIAGKVDDIARYDTVYLGYPIWWYVAPTIINTFIENNNLEGKTVICFATSGGSPIAPCVDSLKKEYPSVKWTEGRLLNNASEADIKAWAESFKR